jgi:hypothetical protein
VISQKIREYFDYLSKISNRSRDIYINFLFKSFEAVSGKSLDDYSIPHDLLIGKEINDSNYSIMFACFKVYIFNHRHFTTKINNFS